MNIKKLGLASTIAMLSVTVPLSGCDLFKSAASKLAELTLDKADVERDEDRAKWKKAYDEWWKASDEWWKAFTKYDEDKSKFGINSAEYNKAKVEYDKAEAEYNKAKVEYKEDSDKHTKFIMNNLSYENI